MTELERLTAAEAAAEAARMTLARRELSRSQGVAWSGMTPTLPTVSSPAVVSARAQARLAARQAWRATAEGGFVSAVVACQAAARQAFTTAERARAGASREEPVEWRREVLDELSAQARALAAGVRQARRALTR